ncbi:hypothetical protein L208DRAFT_1244812, partial [Tricholoma matsutake]
IAENFCMESVPERLEEAGCAVCGQLTPVSQLTRLKAVINQLHVLEASGTTRVEQRNISDPVHKFQGPVLDYKCNCLCYSCHKHIRKNERPPHALANGSWIGDIPEELASLRFVEKMLITCVRVSCCFVHVASSGLKKWLHMSSHLSHLSLRCTIVSLCL